MSIQQIVKRVLKEEFEKQEVLEIPSLKIFGKSKGFAWMRLQELLKKTTLKIHCETPCDWNKNYIREIGLFVTGFILHILFEIMGANTWYVKNGSAALSLKRSR